MEGAGALVAQQDKMRPSVVLIYLLLILGEGSALASSQPRRSVPCHEINMKRFADPGFANLSSLLVREDAGQLVVGARGTVITLSMDDISDKISETKWTVSPEDKSVCQMKGRDASDCENFIKALHTTRDGRMLVCGTNAFNPVCNYMTFADGQVILEGKQVAGKGKVPFDPNQRHTSLMVENVLHSATSSNFLGTESVFQKNGPSPLKTESEGFWLNDPTFVSMKLVETSKNSQDGEDDNIFLFFTETAMKRWSANTQVSRIARVCKGDMGGRRTLQRKWTSFLKARLDCPMGQRGMQSLVQDVFLLKDQNDWRDSVFYATFTSDLKSSATSSRSAVCAYKLSDVSQAFSGRFLTQRVGKWVPYTGEVPVPRPGSCINNAMREMGVRSSLDLPDKTLQFVKNHPLMEQVVRPLTGRPLLVKTGTRFSKIVVDRVTSLDGEQHEVMFIGTDSGWLQKAVRFDGEDGRIIEELQLFETPQPVNVLHLSSKSGQLYTGSHNVAVQVDVRDCSRYSSCSDCVLARDPYCGWDLINGRCAPTVGTSSGFMIQSLTDGDVRICPTSEVKVKPVIIRFTIGISLIVPCSPETNLPVSWQFSDSVLLPSPRHTVLSQGLFITEPTELDAGLYTCETVETIKGNIHRQTVVQYLLLVQDNGGIVIYMEMAVIALVVVFGMAVLAGCSLLVIGVATGHWQNRVCRGNENSNNEHCVITVTPDSLCDQAEDRRMGDLLHCDQAEDRQNGEEISTTQDDNSRSDGSVAMEEERTADTGSMGTVLILPEGTVANQAEEEVVEDGQNNNNHNNNNYVVIEMTM
ncbi:semaphorin-4E-like [Centroberyx gerrardi]